MENIKVVSIIKEPLFTPSNQLYIKRQKNAIHSFMDLFGALEFQIEKEVHKNAHFYLRGFGVNSFQKLQLLFLGLLNLINFLLRITFLFFGHLFYFSVKGALKRFHF